MIEFELVGDLSLREILDISLWNLGGDVIIENNLERSYQELKCEKISTECGDRFIIYAYDWENRAYLLGIFRGWTNKGNLKYLTDQDDHLRVQGRAVQVSMEDGLIIEGL
jgi:hypothetical protein